MNLIIIGLEIWIALYIVLGICAQALKSPLQRPISLAPITGDPKLFCDPEAWNTLSQVPRTEVLKALREALYPLGGQYLAISTLALDGQQFALSIGPTNLGKLELTIRRAIATGPAPQGS